MSKKDNVKTYLIKRIEMMNSHERIISRTALCQKFHYSRTTIDMAIKELTEEGVVYSVKGSGSYVSQQYKAMHIHDGVIPKWGIILPNSSVGIYPELLHGITSYCEEKGINTVVFNTGHDVGNQNDYALRLLELGVKGIIIIPSKHKDTVMNGLNALREVGIPVVFCYRYIETGAEYPFVATNDFFGGFIATKHLLEHGYKKIGFASLQGEKVGIERFLGYSSALAMNNIEVNNEFIFIEAEKNYDRNSGESLYRRLRKAFLSGTDVDAFFCYNDRVAKIVYKAAESVGKEIGTDIGVVGYDNSPICMKMKPPLSSVEFKAFLMGKKCAELLEKAVSDSDGKKHEILPFQPEIIVRESSLGKMV